MIGADRLADWAENLHRLIQQSSDKEFKWGEYDCSQFCIDAELSIIGSTRFEDYYRNYKSKKGAAWRLKQKGFNNVWELVDSRLDRIENVKLAQRGDVIGHMTDIGESLGIVTGRTFACVGDPKGIVFKPLSKAVFAWRI